MPDKIAVIFDLDGTLIDNNSFHIKAWQEFYKKRNRTLTEEEYKEHFNGKTNTDVLAYVFEHTLSPQENETYTTEKEDLYRSIYEPHIQPIKGLLNFLQLLQDAKIPIKDGKRVLPNGEIFTIEFLLDEPSFQPHHATFIKNLGQLGIEASIRLIDAVQYRARVESFDFDMTTMRLSMSPTPGDSLRPYFTSHAAATKGSYNLAGVANPAIDALVDKAIGAETRTDLTIACRALDRVFRAGRYWVPQWFRSTHPIAYWDMFAHPPKPARYAQGTGAPENWWYDAAGAAKLEQAK